MALYPYAIGIHEVTRRLVEERRVDLRNDIQAANREFKAGKCREVTAAKLGTHGESYAH